MNSDTRLYEVTVDAIYPGFRHCGCGVDGPIRLQMSYREPGGDAKFCVNLCLKCANNLRHRINSAVATALALSAEMGAHE